MTLVGHQASADSCAGDQFEGLINAIGSPHVRGERYAIFRGDALELLDSIPGGSIGLTLTSPPYNIGKKYEKVREL
jgi:adenine-specific DNA-methyltransferase